MFYLPGSTDGQLSLLTLRGTNTAAVDMLMNRVSAPAGCLRLATVTVVGALKDRTYSLHSPLEGLSVGTVRALLCGVSYSLPRAGATLE